MLGKLLSSLVCVAALVGCGGADAGTDDSQAGAESAIVGGSRDLRWAASGYLLAGPSMDRLDASKPACGATLIAPNVVVTAAHCATREAAKELAFGTGDVSKASVVRVIERHAHPAFHARPDGMIDIPYVLRKNDVAYLVLEHAITSVKPAELPSAAPAIGCNVQAIGYHVPAPGKPSARMSTPACVELNVMLGDDPIFEVHPASSSGLCNTDGDEGSPVVLRDASREVLVGFYVGSVTSFLTDCHASVQFLDGYESAYGYRSFFAEGLARGKQLAR
jgi:secreted trypsin-like serine protease